MIDTRDGMKKLEMRGVQMMERGIKYVTIATEAPLPLPFMAAC